MSAGEAAIGAPPDPPVLHAAGRVSRVREFPAWPVAVLGVPIVFRAAVFATVLLTEPWSANPNRIIPAWAQILQATIFASLALVLVYSGRTDRRAWSLGLFILDAAATLVAPFVRAVDAPSWLAWVGLRLPTDAFQAALLWFFAGVFPRRSASPALVRAFVVGAAASFALGLLLLMSDIYAQLVGDAPQNLLGSVAQALRRKAPGESPSDSDWYFTLQFLLLVPLLVAMPLKLRESGPDDRRRFMWLAVGIVVGFLPLAADVLLVTLWPWYATTSVQPPYFRLKGLVILIALTAVPLAGAYAALVQRTLDVRLVVRTALQYVLARSVIGGVAAAPVLALVALVALNRERSVMELVSGPLGLSLAGLTAAAILAAAGHRRLMAALDLRFFRQEIDARATLLAVADAVRQSASLDEFRDTLVRATCDAFHPATVAAMVAGADESLHALDADLPSLGGGSALAQLLAATDIPLDVNLRSSPIVGRLRGRDREWLDRAAATLAVPLRGSTGALLGVLALGEKKSELPYTEEDRKLLAAVGTAGGLALDRILIASRDAQDGSGTVLADPAARECVECGTVLDADAIACVCGGLLQRAPAPRVLGDRLRFDQRIGAGGMGVVYRAFDLRLQQPRAVKTLPGTDPTLMSRMRREARTMAAAKHLNLATLHGFETWRGAPMLVMEFLEGGTLADRLRRGVLPVDETVALGITLAGAMGVLHASGILHRDIKPSNIGFTADGVPKLLDFGLARLAPPAPGSTGSSDGEDSTWSVSLSGGAGAIRGTPAYLSPWVLSGEPASARDDCWSLAVTLLEACTGSNPFRAPTVAATLARVMLEPQRAFVATAALPIAARLLFADLLGSHVRRPDTAPDFVYRLRECPPTGGQDGQSPEV